MKKLIAALRIRYRFIDRYFSDHAFKSLVTLRLTTAVNFIFALVKLVTGVIYRSIWLVTLAAYYGLLVAMKLLLLRNVNAEEIGNDLPGEFKRYRACAVALLFMNATLMGMVVLAIHRNEGFRYGGMLIYAMAAYDFYIMISAVINLVKARRHGSPLLSASRVVSFASALIAMLSLEMAMMARFGDGDIVFRNAMLAGTGGVISLVFIATAVAMLIRSGREIIKLKLEDAPR